MSNFDVILHATDFSAESDEAFELACNVARDRSAKLIVLHVIPPALVADGDLDLLSEDRPEIRRCREQFLRMKAAAGDIPISFRIVTGYPVGMILNVAREEEATLIVIASYQHSHLSFQLHGSVAEGVLRQAHCPVLCFRQPSFSGAVAAGRRHKFNSLN